MTTIHDQIKAYWHKHPVGTNFIQGEVGTAFFLAYDRFRYSTEGHILQELDTTDWRGKNVLEIGTGQGADAMQLIQRGGRFSGIDLTEESIYRVQERFRLFNLPYECLAVADGRTIPFADNSFDVVYTHGVIHHSPHMAAILQECSRVLKPGGQLILMVYHKQSLNYWLNIFFVRRIGLVLMRCFPPLLQLISKLTGESTERLKKHLLHFRQQGPGYLAMRNFLHRNTDGPDNIYSSVWTKKSLGRLLSGFSATTYRVHFLNERHLLGFQKFLSKRLKNKLASLWGWHLWAYATK